MTPERTGFLYPFIEAERADPAELMADLAASATSKALESAALKSATIDRTSSELETIAHRMASSFRSGARLFTMGNGGSSTDAQGLAALFSDPPLGTPLPSRSLSADEAIVTAVANDVGFELVFSRQIIAYARPGDVVVGFSTSGNSPNLISAFSEAKRRGLLTIGLAGYEGGQMAACGDIDHCLVVRSDSIHRIQETQSALAYRIWDRVRQLLCEDSPS